MNARVDGPTEQSGGLNQGNRGGTLAIAVAGAGQAQSKFEVAAGRSVRLDIPAGFAADHVALATRDADIMAEMLKRHPDELSQIVNNVLLGNFREAERTAEHLGLTEEKVISQGGGLWGIIIICVACALLLAHD